MISIGNKINSLPGEKLKINNTPGKTYNKVSDTKINDKYTKGDVRLITEQARYPLSTILSMVESPNYILNPEFQRRHRWNTAKKSKLIESIIMNVPIPPIFLYEKEFSTFEVMDGLQRLTAIQQFYKDEYELEGLVEWPELIGRRYSTLPTQVRKGIDRRYISSIIILQETAKDDKEAQRLKQLVFERINSGGEKLTSQETRNAIYNGPVNQLCIRLARNTYFCDLWDIPKPTQEELLNPEDISDELRKNRFFSKMEDAEIVLRFFAYRHLEQWDVPILELFLDEYLQKSNTFSIVTIDALEEIFLETIEFVHTVFGSKAFYIYRERREKESDTTNWEFFERASKTIYDPLMYVMATLLAKKRDIISKKDDVARSMPVFYRDNYKSFEGRSSNRNDVIRRINLLHAHLEPFSL